MERKQVSKSKPSGAANLRRKGQEIMKKIIKGKLYNTDTATFVAEHEKHARSSFSWYHEALYLKKTGEYFLWGEGHAASPYNTACPDGGSDPGEAIRPISYVEAREWAEKHMTADEYIHLFGEPEEDESKTKLTLHIRRDLVNKIKQLAAKSSKTISEYIEDMISECIEDMINA